MLSVSYAGPGLSEQVIPAGVLARPAPAAAKAQTTRPTSAATATQASAALNTSLLLYPNPAHDDVAIDLQAAEAAEVRVAVYDALGQCVAHLAQAAPAGPSTLHLPIGRLATGVYSVAVQCGAGQCVRRLAVVR